MRKSMRLLPGIASFVAVAALAQVAPLPGTVPVEQSVSPAARNPATAMPPPGRSATGDRALAGRAALGTANPGATLPGTVSPNTATPPVATDAGVAGNGRVGTTLNGGAAVDGTVSTAPPPR